MSLRVVTGWGLAAIAVGIVGGCRKSTTNAASLASQDAAPSTDSTAPLGTAARADGAPTLAWGALSGPPAAALASAAALADLDVIILFDTLKKRPLVPGRYAAFFPEFAQANDEFARQRLAANVQTSLNGRARALGASPLYVRVDVPIGEYDFMREAFPLRSGTGKGAKQHIPTVVAFADRSDSALSMLERVNLAARDNGRSYASMNSFVEFANSDDESVFAAEVSVAKPRAETVVKAFGVGTDATDREVSKKLGVKYEGYRMAVAYVVIEPISADDEPTLLEGQRITHPVVKARATAVVLTSDGKNVLGAWPSAEPDAPKKIAAGLDRPHTLTGDASYVYSASDHDVVRIARSDGTTNSLLGDLNASMEGVAVDDDSIFVTNSSFVTDEQQLVRVSKKDLSLTTLVSGGVNPTVIALDAKNLYWVSLYKLAVYRSSKSGGMGAKLFGFVSGDSPHALATDDDYVYATAGLTENELPDLFRVPKRGGARKVLVSKTGAADLGVDADSVVYRNGNGIFRVPKDGGEPQLVTDPKAGSTASLYVDGAGAAWTTWNGVHGLLFYAPRGGVPWVVSSKLQSENGRETRLWMDGASIFWITSGALYMLPRAPH